MSGQSLPEEVARGKLQVSGFTPTTARSDLPPSLYHGAKKTVRSMLGREGPKVAVGAYNTRCLHGRLQDVLDGFEGIGDFEGASQRVQHFADDQFVLLWFE